MLALDVSGSMCSTDVKPNRITAAEQAATAFIKSQTGGPWNGLVAFASTAVVLVPPTADTKQLLSALGGLTTSFGTAIGEGILTSLDAIAQVDRSVAPTGVTVSRDRGAGDADDVIVGRRRRLEQPGDRPADCGEGGQAGACASSRSATAPITPRRSRAAPHSSAGSAAWASGGSAACRRGGQPVRRR